MRNSSLTLLKFGIISLVSLHWVACVWALLPTLQHERHGWTGDPDSTHLAGRGDRPLALYVQSFEYAITTMVMDQARSQPTNTFEQGIWLVVALVMGALYAYIIGVISAVVTNMDPATTEFNAISDLLDSYMRELGLDEETADRARRYLTATELHFRQDYYRKLLAMLSPELRGVFAQQLCGVWVHQIWFFNCPDINERARFVTAVALHLKVSAFNRMECIVRVGERADAMYIVRRGIVGVRGVPFSCGKFFGEEMIRDGQWRDYSAICATFSDLHVLHKEDLRAILAESRFPRTRSMIRLRVLYMTFQRHIKLVVKAARMRPGYVRPSPDERSKYVARLKELGAMRIPPPEKRDALARGSLDDAPSDDEAGARRAPKLAPLDGAFSATYHDAEAAARAQLREPPRPIDFPKMRKIRTLHKEGSNAFHEELRTAHGIDAKDLDGSQVRADTDAFQSVCEPERDGGAVTRREVEELLCDLERRLKGEAPATSTSPVTALSDSPRRTAAAVDFEIADLRRKLEELEQARDRLSREDMSGGSVRRLSMVGNA